MKKTILLITLIFTTLVFAQKPKADVLRFDPQTGTPLNPQKGWVYYSSLDDEIYKYNGTSWIQIGSGPSGSSLTITDGTNTITEVTNINFTGATVSGTTPNSVITISGGGGSGSGLEKITEGANSGWVLVGDNRSFKGDIGFNAIDISFKESASTNDGATGDYSFAGGFGSIASNFGAFAYSEEGAASGEYSVIFNGSNNAIGYYSMTVGEENFSPSYGEFSLGVYGTNYTANSVSSFNVNDRLFNIGNGQNSSNRSDAFSVMKNGSIIFHPVAKSTILNPVAGTYIMDSEESNKLKFYDGTNWREITTTVD